MFIEKTYTIVSICMLLLNIIIYTIIFSYIQLILKIPLIYPIGLASSIILSLVTLKSNKRKKICFFSLFFLLIVGWLSIHIYDVSFDGSTYHQEAIIQIAKGWNPYWDTELKGMHSLWINSYPKALWIFGAVLYTLTGSIIVGKCYQIIFLIIALIFIYKFLQSIKMINKYWIVNSKLNRFFKGIFFECSWC